MTHSILFDQTSLSMSTYYLNLLFGGLMAEIQFPFNYTDQHITTVTTNCCSRFCIASICRFTVVNITIASFVYKKKTVFTGLSAKTHSIQSHSAVDNHFDSLSEGYHTALLSAHLMEKNKSITSRQNLGLSGMKVSATTAQTQGRAQTTTNTRQLWNWYAEPILKLQPGHSGTQTQRANETNSIPDAFFFLFHWSFG